jgi:hypothetical protein
MIEPKHPKLSVSQQCALLELPRASYYRQPQPESDNEVDPEHETAGTGWLVMD